MQAPEKEPGASGSLSPFQIPGQVRDWPEAGKKITGIHEFAKIAPKRGVVPSIEEFDRTRARLRMDALMLSRATRSAGLWRYDEPVEQDGSSDTHVPDVVAAARPAAFTNGHERSDRIGVNNHDIARGNPRAGAILE